MSDVSYELAYEGLGFAVMGDPGIHGGIKSSLFGGSGLSDFVGKYLPIPAQGYCVDLYTMVDFTGHALGPILHGQQQSCIEGELSV